MTKPKKAPATAKTAPPNKEEVPTGTESTPETGGGDHLQDAFPVVGIGASAGGLAAFEAFFSGMPADTDPGMAFVLVQHLAPDHKSILTDLIRRYTRMQVYEVEDGMRVLPNRAYIIPPNHDMAFLNGSLQLLEPGSSRGQRLPIDFFFRSLAQDQRERAIGIVLSGTGSDGTLGVRAIKGEGGMVMAQSPGSTEYDGMPRSAIATGLVDFVLPANEMPAQLIAYTTHAFGKPSADATIPTPKSESLLKKIFILLRSQTGHDFSFYKSNTINRRIERRMVVHQIGAMAEYVRYLQQNPDEIAALFRDLLIGVTNFFRDREAFTTLEEQAIPRLFADKPAGALIRVWVPGCSTGEEAYSIAILLQEHMETLKRGYKAQVFATDIDSQAIATGRAGVYPASIATDIPPQRLTRFFAGESEGTTYRIDKAIRDMLVFSEQDVTKDPPFSKLDLISCRNLLIYMGGDLQKRLIPLFHYALNPGGFLFLGTSETIGESADLFVTVDRKGRLYQRKEDLAGAPHVALGQITPPMTRHEGVYPTVSTRTDAPKRLPLQELTERALLQEVTPAGVLVNAQGDVLYLHGRSGMYLELPPGSMTTNVLKIAREGLRHSLTVALSKAVGTKDTVRHPGLRVKTNGEFTMVDLTIRPIAAGTPEAFLYLVVLQQAPDPVPVKARHAAKGTEGSPAADADATVATLRQELRAKDEYLQTTNEELETANEELKSSNEEMQSVNEELQSTNEELETSKEELQSMNEELSTVNAELQQKVADLSQANNDMNNLLSGTGIGTVFVDHQLHILRFTPTATRIINLIPGDIGRPVGHIVSNLVGYDALVADTQAVLDSLLPKEVEVQSRTGSWYSMRILPYRTLTNVIEGAVITFTDVSEMKKAREALRAVEDLQRLAAVVRDAQDAITVQDLAGSILAWNRGAERMYGWSRAEAQMMNIRDMVPEDTREGVLSLLRELSDAQILKPHGMSRITKSGLIVEVWLTATALTDQTGAMYAIATTERTRKGPTVETRSRKKGTRS
jgi:two-component system, chemotaxis family, CheB/CheR fusion protein